jgi:hypothetical protein
MAFAPRMLIIAALAACGLGTPLYAKAPAKEDEDAIRAMIEKVYAGYMREIPEAPEDGSYAPTNEPGEAADGYDLPSTASLDALINKWGDLMRENEELYRLNSFDWYCQCQDNDNKTSKIVSQKYVAAGKNRINARVVFSPGRTEDGKDSGAPLIFNFKREGGAWKLDDLKFDDFTTLRKGLALDIRDAEKDRAKAKAQSK